METYGNGENQEFAGQNYEQFAGSNAGEAPAAVGGEAAGGSVDFSNLFVNYLPPHFRDAELYQLFAPYGEVETYRVLIDFNTQQSRGYGFVKFRDADSAKAAIEGVNGRKIGNKTLLVRCANPTTTQESEPSANLYIQNLPLTMNEEQLTAMFSPFGAVTECKILVDNQGQSRGVGFVTYSSVDEASRGISSLHGHLVEGTVTPMTVKYADSEQQRQQRKQKRQMAKQRNYQRNNNQYHPYQNQGGGYGAQPYAQYNMYGGQQQQQQQQQMGGYGGYGQQMGGMGMGMDNQAPAAAGGAAGGMGMGGGMGGGMGTGTQTPDQQSRTLFIYHLPYDSDDNLLYRLFSPYGAIEAVKVITEPGSTKCKGYGFVTMCNWNDAYNAVQTMHGAKVGTKYLKVSFKK